MRQRLPSDDEYVLLEEDLAKGETPMESEVLRILKMVEEKKITAEEAAKLLEALPKSAEPEEKSVGTPEWFYIRVNDQSGDKPKNVNIRLPFGLARFAVRHIPRNVRDNMEKEGVDVEELIRKCCTGNQGKVIVVNEPGKNVEIGFE